VRVSIVGPALACGELVESAAVPSRSTHDNNNGMPTSGSPTRASVTLLACVALLLAPIIRAADADLRPWPAYRTIMWVGSSAYKKPEKLPLFFQRLREMGINAVSVHADGKAEPVLANQFSYYVENIVNRGLCLKFNSNVRDWDTFTTDWTKNGRPESALIRDYCLDDPKWRESARQLVQSQARKHRANAPLLYDLRDELSVTISANPFDYDFSPIALAKFRAWLKTQYRDLAALNTGWETRFESWEAVRPFTTDQIKNRMSSGEALPRGQPDWQALRRLKFDPATAAAQPTRWNFSPWADFRTYMDISLAAALGDLRSAAREIDPHTPVGIEGTQMPSAFGGYDLWRLSQVLDWVEPYDIGNAREIFGSFMPEKTFLTTVFEKDTNHARRRLWHLLLEGDRACLVWWSEDCIDWQSDDYALTPKAQALAPVLRELQSPLAALFLRAHRETDPIHLVYSQPSIQVDWLLESTTDGPSWIRRFSSHEAAHNRLAAKRGAWMKLLQDSGYTPRFVAAEKLSEITGGVLVFSDVLAFSDGELKTTESFSGAIVADAPVGVFDEHGRLRPAAGRLNDRTLKPEQDIAQFGRERLASPSTAWFAWAKEHIPVPRTITVPPETHTRVHRYKLGNALLLGFERNIDYHMSEDLKQAGGNEALEHAVEITATLAAGGHAYDLRSGRYLGQTDRLTFTLDPWQPSLFAVVPEKIDGSDIVATLMGK
jgi:hypothetical protein